MAEKPKQGKTFEQNHALIHESCFTSFRYCIFNRASNVVAIAGLTQVKQASLRLVKDVFQAIIQGVQC